MTYYEFLSANLYNLPGLIRLGVLYDGVINHYNFYKDYLNIKDRYIYRRNTYRLTLTAVAEKHKISRKTAYNIITKMETNLLQ